MDEICPVCDKKIATINFNTIQGIDIHNTCIAVFSKNPELYGGKAIVKTENADDQFDLGLFPDNDKSVHVKSFNMPFLDMVMFMVKWAIASIPAFIILFIIGAIFTTIFGVSLLSFFK